MILEATELKDYKEQLRRDAEQAASDPSSPRWMDTAQWPQYTEKHIYNELYQAFSDQELLDILRDAADKLGRLPYKNEVFCIYRVFIQRRFQNWPKAQTAAGLRPSVEMRRAQTRRRHRHNERQKAKCRNQGQAERRWKEERERLGNADVPHNESAPG